MKTLQTLFLLFLFSTIKIVAGTIEIFSPSSVEYCDAVGATSKNTWFNIGGSGSGYPYVNIYKFVVKLDGNTIFDSPDLYPQFWHTISGLGNHTVYVEMWEENILGQRVRTTTKTKTVTLEPIFNIYIENSFGAGGQINVDGNTELTVDVDGINAVKKVWGKNTNHTLEAIDNQTIGGLLRTWKYWTFNGNTEFNIQASQLITTQTTFTANFNTQPATPTNFSANTQSGIQLSWTAIADPIQYYEVWRKVNNNSFVLHSTTTGTSFVDPDFALGGNTNLYYKIRAKGTNGLFSEYTNIVSISNAAPYNNGADIVQISETPTEFGLHQNFPNPFNPSTEISYSVPEPSFVTLSVFNSVGQEVAQLVKGYKETGNHSVTWNANGLPSGVYFYSFKAGKYSSLKKMVLAK